MRRWLPATAVFASVILSLWAIFAPAWKSVSVVVIKDPHIEAADNAIRRCPSAENYFKRGLLYYQGGKIQDAAADFNTAICMDSTQENNVKEALKGNVTISVMIWDSETKKLPLSLQDRSMVFKSNGEKIETKLTSLSASR